jgi:endonuclease YncB( thermonuclease family)
MLALVSFWIIFTLQTAELRGTVERVVDGDTLIVLLADGTRERVRLAAIDAPEISRKRPDPRGLAAAEFVRRACLDQAVLLIPAPGHRQFTRDPYRRLLARVSIRGADLGGSLVLLGLAIPWSMGRKER